ncbi:peptide chain release factor N(5)-glutamine methyltransferase, partial [Acidimicrobiaceae bacterium AH-315-P05]|nr:peptide chain release factor N(5)-glutamine methyltransferase [Acidimicrobiaceae bacterium AH-315-P05]
MNRAELSWGDLVTEAQTCLKHVRNPNAADEARWLVEEAAGFTAAELVLWRSETPTVGGVSRFDAMLVRRAAGEPIQYVLGHWPFRSLDLLVDQRALIPRPETELLVGYALDVLESMPGRPTVVDLGTGSGAIGLAIAAENRASRVWLTDTDPDALALTRANLAGLGASGSRATIAKGNWFEALDPAMQGEVNVIVSNPPYVADDESLPESVSKWEPASALFSGPRGLEALELLLSEARSWLAIGGTILLEHGFSQRAAVVELATVAGYTKIKSFRDGNGLDRVLQAT